MRRRTFLATTAALALTCHGRSPGVISVPRQRGVAFDGYRGTPTPDDFAAVRALGTTHIALWPYGFMNAYTDPAVYRFERPDTDWSLTDTGLLETARLARDAGLAVIVLPTLEDFRDGHWRGEVRMADSASWAAWFASYGEFVLHYADLAERMHAVGFSVGTELRETVRRETEWRRLIAEVRGRFSGWITYAGNWDDYANVPWWDALDAIGVQAYFELGDPGPGSLPERVQRLRAEWAPIARDLARVSERWDRPVLFTEIGYKSHTASTARPWRWEIEGDPDAELQAAAYEAAFATFWDLPWFAGFYWWKWHPVGAPVRDRRRNFTPQGKPAEEVMKRYYRKVSGR